jgi:hypothetical protein
MTKYAESRSDFFSINIKLKVAIIIKEKKIIKKIFKRVLMACIARLTYKLL